MPPSAFIAKLFGCSMQIFVSRFVSFMIVPYWSHFVKREYELFLKFIFTNRDTYDSIYIITNSDYSKTIVPLMGGISMGTEKVVSGRINKIVSCKEKEGRQRNNQWEWNAEDEYIQEHRFEWVARFDTQTDLEYEYLLHKEAEWNTSLKKDMWSRESWIPSSQIWYEYEMTVNYLYQNHLYERHVKWEWHTKALKEGQIIYIAFNKDAPEEIVRISTDNERYKTLFYLAGALITGMLLAAGICLLI